ncbi:hypothetical protein [Lambdina fiscellaria nucleopolyhedrovirus]|uniref:Uncharacterized protein n=1 Tax=Lambdina fiscellaria nucleopolyhedrovirus TaxID=1642929 RepID=A0A0E3Z640_9ABAC|nr:hypothetical protein [Lambdina fiscellaria nucleopolyhedrovirus]AKC91721.1 hypothetical protein [Lambdina fiscellaria nucleopolyhedrovirus]
MDLNIYFFAFESNVHARAHINVSKNLIVKRIIKHGVAAHVRCRRRRHCHETAFGRENFGIRRNCLIAQTE